MMQAFRNAAKPVVVLITITFLVWMIVDLSGITSTGGFFGNSSVGSINGQDVDVRVYQQAVQEEMNRRGGGLGIEEVEQVRNDVWESFVQNVSLTSEIKRRNIAVSDDEIAQALLNVPPQEIQTAPDFQTDGKFDMAKYQRWLGSPVGQQYVPVLEQRYREELLRNKLLLTVTADVFVSDAALWERYRDQNETSKISMTAVLPRNAVPDSAVTVTPAEVEAYYNSHKAEFTRSRTTFMSYLAVNRRLDAGDSLAARTKALELRQEILGGAAFADVAQRESTDTLSARQGGDLGEFPKGQMAAAFDSAVFSLPLNTLSQPVETGFGIHLIEVTKRDGNKATARHILIPIELAGAHRTLVDAQADTLERLAAERLDPAVLDTAARALKAPIGQTGPIQAGSRVLLGTFVIPDAGTWSQQAQVGETSPVIEGEAAFYVFRLDSVQEAGAPALASIRAVVERSAREQKKEAKAKALAEELLNRVRAGTPLPEASKAMGLPNQEFGPFPRIRPPLEHPILVGAAFGLPEGRVSDVLTADGAAYVMQVLQRLPTDSAAFLAQRDQQRADAIRAAKQDRVRLYLASLRAQAKVKDNRTRFFKTAAQTEATAAAQTPAQ